MRISVVRPGELGADEIATWHFLQGQTRSVANPFLCPEFAVAVDTFRPDARVAVLADRSTIVGFFPFERRRFGVGAPIGAGLNDCQGVIHAPGAEWDFGELLRACKLTAWQFDHLIEDQWPRDGDTVAPAPSRIIDLTDGFAAYTEKLRIKSPRFRKDLGRKERKLTRDAGELRFVVDSRDKAVLRTLMEWKSAQYHQNGWVDVFDRPWIVDLVDYLFSTHSDRFSGLLSLLYAGETPVAGHFGLWSRHVLAHWFPAYDTQYSRQSPGLIQHLRMVEECASLGIELIDMGTGDERYKQTLRNRDTLVAEGVVTQASLSATAYRVRRAMEGWARHQVRQHPALFHAADRLLRHYGRIG